MSQQHVLFNTYYVNLMLQLGFLLLLEYYKAPKCLGLLMLYWVSFSPQAFHLECRPFSQKQLWPSSECVLQPALFCPNHSPLAPRAAVLPRRVWGKREGGRGKDEEGLKKESKAGRRSERMTNYIGMDGWIFSHTEIERQRKTEKVKPQHLVWFTPCGEHI